MTKTQAIETLIRAGWSLFDSRRVVNSLWKDMNKKKIEKTFWERNRKANNSITEGQ